MRSFEDKSRLKKSFRPNSVVRLAWPGPQLRPEACTRQDSIIDANGLRTVIDKSSVTHLNARSKHITQAIIHEEGRTVRHRTCG